MCHFIRRFLIGVEQGYSEHADSAESAYALLRRTLRTLPHFQVEGAQGLDFERLLSPNTSASAR